MTIAQDDAVKGRGVLGEGVEVSEAGFRFQFTIEAPSRLL